MWNTVNGEKYYNNYKKMAETTNYKLTLYICESIDGYQNMIVFFTTGRYDKPPENINVKVTKAWEDNNNTYKMRTNSVKITLKADGVAKQTATLSDSNSWTYTFQNLPKLNANKNKITYTVEEEAITGYDYNVDDSNEYNLILTNTIQKKTVPVNKIWKDGDNSSGLRPPSITVKLIADGVDTGKTIILNESNKWKGEFSSLDKYKEGEEISYTIEEVEEIEGYKTEVNGFTITNTLEYETSVVNIKKIWNDNNNNDGLKPELVKVTITSKELNKSEIVELSEQNNWSCTWSDTHEYVDGRIATFSVTEEEVPGYTAEIKETQKNQFTITNSHTPEKIDINVTKVWEDENNMEGKRTNSVTAKLLEDGKYTGKTITLGTSNNWTGKFTNLPKYKNGQQINYTIQEIEEIEGYSSTISGNMSTGFTIINTLKNGAIITNTHEPQRVEVTVNKVWDDENNFDELRPDSVTVTLLADGEPVRENANGVSITSTVILSEKNNWTHTFKDLFKYRHEGIPIVYSIQENAIDPDKNERGEYPYNDPYNDPRPTSKPSTSTEIAYDYTDYKITVTNTHVPRYDGYYEITGTVWKDGNASKGNIPNAIYVIRKRK